MHVPHFPHLFPKIEKNTKYSLIKFYIAMMIPKSWMTFELNVVISPTTRPHSDLVRCFIGRKFDLFDKYLIKYWLIWISQNVLNQIANHQSNGFYHLNIDHAMIFQWVINIIGGLFFQTLLHLYRFFFITIPINQTFNEKSSKVLFMLIKAEIIQQSF